MDNTELLFMSIFSLTKKPLVELFLLSFIVRMIEFWYVKQNIKPSLTIKIMMGIIMT